MSANQNLGNFHVPANAPEIQYIHSANSQPSQLWALHLFSCSFSSNKVDYVAPDNQIIVYLFFHILYSLSCKSFIPAFHPTLKISKRILSLPQSVNKVCLYHLHCCFNHFLNKVYERWRLHLENDILIKHF